MGATENETRYGCEQAEQNKDLVRRMLASADDGDLAVLDEVFPGSDAAARGDSRVT